MSELTVTRRVEFADTDMGGIVHFSRFFVFMETTEYRFLEAIGSSVSTEIDGRPVGWPRVSSQCEYRSPARFGDTLEIRLRVVRKGTKSMTYGFRFRVGTREVAEGKMTSVCCELAPQVRAIPIPESVARRIEEA